MRRTVIVRSVPGPDAVSDQPTVIGKLIDPGDGTEPFGTTPAADDTIRSNRQQQFDRYFMGYSNGYTEWLPEVAVRQPDKWREMVQRLRQQRHRTPEQVQDAFQRAYAETFGA